MHAGRWKRLMRASSWQAFWRYPRRRPPVRKMLTVKRISISGFRGILAPLTIDLKREGGTSAAIVYVRNGTGKSSVTDAWEWFQSERIEHLAREGAGASTYPHRQATDGQTYVEVEFSDASIGTIRLNFDHERVTRPSAQGDLSRVRALIHHPCHVRFADLTRFVYLTKAERYDLLAQLMGFTPQVEFQKALRRVEHEVTEKGEKSLGHAAGMSDMI